MTLLGVPGHAPLAVVDSKGDLLTGRGPIRWSVGAEDRWHHAAEEAAVRHETSGDGAVVATKMRVPGGDVVATVWAAVAAGRPVVVGEFENASPVPVALAVAGAIDDVVARREAVRVAAVAGAPSGALTWPVPHRTTLRVVLVGGPLTPAEIDALAGPTSVTSGWATHLDELARVSVDGVDLADGWRDAVRSLVLAADDPFGGPSPLRTGRGVGRVAVASAVVGLGDQARAMLDGVLRRQRRNGTFPLVDPPGGRAALAWSAARVALLSTGSDDVAGWFASHAEVLARAADRTEPGEPRSSEVGPTVVAAMRRFGMSDAADHLEGRVTRQRRRSSEPATAVADVNPVVVAAGTVLDVVGRLVREEGGGLVLLPSVELHGRGVAVDVHDLATALGTVSFATRWHGEKPALLWELTGGPVGPLRCGLSPSWTGGGERGETLLTA